MKLITLTRVWKAQRTASSLQHGRSATSFRRVAQASVLCLWWVAIAAVLLASPTLHAAGATATVGQSVTFSATAAGTAPFSYQWSKNGAPIAGATAATYNLVAVTTSNSGNYSVRIANVAGATASDVYMLTVNPAPIAPTTLADTGFEKVSVGSNAYQAFAYRPGSSAWTFVGAAGIAGNNSGFTSSNPHAPAGTQVAFIQMSGSMGQDVVLAAGTYIITAQVANRANWGGQQTVLAYVDNKLVGTFKGDVAYSLVTTDPFTVAEGSHSIDFIGLATADSTLFLDQISLMSAPVAIGNRGFESPGVGGGSFRAFQYNPAVVAGVQHWSFVGYAGVTGNNSGFTSQNPDAPEGNQVAFLQSSGSTISQSIVFPRAGSYTLLISAAQRGNWNMGAQQANVYLDGAFLGTFTPASTHYQTISLPLPATQGAHVLSFKGMSSGDCTLFLDRVSISTP